MHHDQPAFAPRDLEHVEYLRVRKLQVVVGHVDLERSAAVADQLRQFVVQHGGRGVGDDQVERVVDAGLAGSATVIVLDGRRERMALGLGGERDHGGGAAAGSGTGAGREIVGHDHRCGHRLVEMAVGVDAARQDVAAGGIDFARAALQPLAESGDASAAHANVAMLQIAGGHDGGVAHHQVERAAHPATGRAVTCGLMQRVFMWAPVTSGLWPVQRTAVNAFTGRALTVAAAALTNFAASPAPIVTGIRRSPTK